MRAARFKGNGKGYVKFITLAKGLPLAIVPTVLNGFYAIGVCYHAAQVQRTVCINAKRIINGRGARLQTGFGEESGAIVFVGSLREIRAKAVCRVLAGGLRHALINGNDKVASTVQNTRGGKGVFAC